MATTASPRAPEGFRKGRKCPYCSREFFKADHFHRHLRSHTKEKPFSCKDCGRRYQRHDTMLRHIRNHHHKQHLEENKLNPDSSYPETGGVSTTPSSASWMDTTSLTSSQQQSGIFEDQGAFDPETVTQATTTYAAQSLMSESKDNEFPLGNNGILPRDATYSMPVYLNESQSVARLKASPVEPVALAPGQHEIQSTFPARGFEGLHGEMDAADWFLQDNYNLNSFGDLVFGLNNAHFPASRPETGTFCAGFAPSSNSNACRTRTDSGRQIPDLRQCWYTQVFLTDSLRNSTSRPMTPVPVDDQSKDNIDESYRVSAASKLRPQPRIETLPPIGLLNLFIHLFFTRFNVVLPLIHRPTFQPTKENALLVLSICSAGSLWFRSQQATNAGRMLFERVNKAILESPWEKHLLRNESDTFNTLKASVIGQTFGLLSGNPIHLETAGAFHGAVLSAARRLKLFSDISEFSFEANMSTSQLRKTWRSWAKNEERNRIAACLYIHDAEIADLFHHEPLLRHDMGRPWRLSSTELFNAPSAEAWIARLRIERGESSKLDMNSCRNGLSIAQSPCESIDDWHSCPVASPSMLELQLPLSSIGASIAAHRRLGTLTMESQAKYEAQLLSWYTNTANASDNWPLSETGTSQLTLNVLTLWHYTWIVLHVDMNILELAFGREGSDVSPSTISYVESWARGKESMRCVLHAYLLQDCLVRMPAEPVVALHIPRIVFAAAVVWHCYTTYHPKTILATDRNLHIDAAGFGYFRSLPEIRMMTKDCETPRPWAGAWVRARNHRLPNDILAQLQECFGSVFSQMKEHTLYGLTEILRRSVSYGIAGRMADIIEISLAHSMDPTYGNR